MTTDFPGIQDDAGGWSAAHCAVSIERLAEADGIVRVVMLRHPDYPFVGRVGQADLESGLRAIANEYVDAVAGRAGIGASVVHALRSDARPDFGWLGLSWGAEQGIGERKDPRNSFWVARHDDHGAIDRTAVLLAGRRLKEGRSAGGRVGLRVVLHVSLADADGHCEVRATSLSVSNLPHDLDHEPFARVLRRMDLQTTTIDDLVAFAYANLPGLGRLLDSGAVTLQGIAVDGLEGREVVRLFGTSSRADDGCVDERNCPSSFSYVGELALNEKTFRILTRVERSAEMNVAIFERDPASCGDARTRARRRPTRPERQLDAFRVATSRVPARLEHLRAPGQALMQVRQTRTGNREGDPAKVHELPSTPLALRSDHLAAAHAYVRGLELFDRLHAYGLRPEHYFKFARLPLVLRHRAPLRGARDGNGVNAQVRPCGNGLELGRSWDDPNLADSRPELEVSFGAADLWHRSLQPNDVGRLRAQPLGLAADQRWAWHEFGHVLNFASFGELELRFAHSAGDGLAAIVADPDSELAHHESARYETFPWVLTSRRHDRHPLRGWGWCGRRSRARSRCGASVDDRRQGYFEEQILSSSLFRLYRCIGGDTFDADDTVRRSASDYTVYLVMRAIALLGPDGVVPARTVDQFVTALIDADLGTGAWRIVAGWPSRRPTPRTVSRVGGWLHKVIRWAFEQQGLYATDDPSATAEGVGLPPWVDLFIADARSPTTQPADGGYHPVALAWSDDVPQAWHASPQGIEDPDETGLSVRVGNRGRIDARRVDVAAWIAPLSRRGDRSAWVRLASVASAAQDVPSGGSVAFRFATQSGGSRPQGAYLVWALASCTADRSNAALDSPQPEEPGDRLLVDLIANDNNQGLRIVVF